MILKVDYTGVFAFITHLQWFGLVVLHSLRMIHVTYTNMLVIQIIDPIFVRVPYGFLLGLHWETEHKPKLIGAIQ